MDFASKYRPATLDEMTEQGATVEILRNTCNGDMVNRNFLFTGPAGTGKAQPLYSKVLTVDGYKAMRDIDVGDRVFTAKGDIATVCRVFPQGRRDAYRIKFTDGTHIDVADNHLNEVYFEDEDAGVKECMTLDTLSLKDRYDKGKWEYRVEIPDSIDWDESPVQVNPYLAGILISNGSLNSREIYIPDMDDDVLSEVDGILRNEWGCCLKHKSKYKWFVSSSAGTNLYNIHYKGYRFTTWDQLRQCLVSEGYPDIHRGTLKRIADGKMRHSPYVREYPELSEFITYTCNAGRGNKIHLWNTLNSMGLCVSSCDKRIPMQYLLNSRDVRLKLLQGMMDVNGYVFESMRGGAGDGMQFFTPSRHLSNDFEFLVRSLGIVDSVEVRMNPYNHGNQSVPFYAHDLQVCDPMRYEVSSSKRNLSHIKAGGKAPVRGIRDVSPIGSLECKCILVDHPDHTYITDNFTPTHNTTMARIVNNMLNGGECDPVEVDAASYSGVDDVREIVQQMRTYPLKGRYKVFIIDECFPANSKVLTHSGYKSICAIKPGDNVYTIGGYREVERVFENDIAPSRLMRVDLNNGHHIVTTESHLFFTNCGWIECRDLKRSDVVYGSYMLQNMWQGINMASFVDEILLLLKLYLEDGDEGSADGDLEDGFATIGGLIDLGGYIGDITESNMYAMMDRLCTYISTGLTITYQKCPDPFEERLCRLLSGIYLSGMWARPDRSFDAFLKVLQSRMLCQALGGGIGDALESNEDLLFGFWSALCEKSVSGHDALCRMVCKIPVDSRMFIQICNDALHGGGSIFVQGTPSKMKGNAFDERGKWDDPGMEMYVTIRCVDARASEPPKIEKVTRYERGSNEWMFHDSFTMGELHSDHVKMYDLQVAGDHNYTVNDVVVHNCHSLSGQAWQALLKPIEEPPAKTVICMCTTNPEKVPKTILSRMQVFQLSKISLDGIYSRLKYILDSERAGNPSIEYDDDAVMYIAKLAEGGMRDGITLLTKVLAFDDHITMQSVQSSLNLADYDEYFGMLNALVKQDVQKIVHMVNGVYNSGVNFINWFAGFHSFMVNIVIYICMRDISQTMIPSTYEDKISGYGDRHLRICLALSDRVMKMVNALKSTQYLKETAITYLCPAR